MAAENSYDTVYSLVAEIIPILLVGSALEISIITGLLSQQRALDQASAGDSLTRWIQKTTEPLREQQVRFSPLRYVMFGLAGELIALTALAVPDTAWQFAPWLHMTTLVLCVVCALTLMTGILMAALHGSVGDSTRRADPPR